ncbi:MAG: ABC transporter substrate-binding protein [Spirochaetaceae bacterium]|jgi:NitT/TauT family transport system substrate-binding protein|nr:ABC transporter substrate-binding protein [Spirochaetaceae bacterium]
MKKNLVLLLILGVLPGLFAAGKTESLAIGFSPGASSTLLMLAADQGYYEQEGVKIEMVSFSNTADGLAALQAKKIDIGLSFGTSAPLTLATKGADIRIIAGNQTGGHPIITKTENAVLYQDITGFKGKVVGTPRLYTPDVVWRGALYYAGLVPGRDLEIVEFKRPVDVLEAVKGGKVDVGIGSSIITARAVEDPSLAVPLFSNDLMPDHPCCRVVTRSDVISQKRPALKALIKSLLRAEQKFQEDPEAAVAANIRQQNWTEAYARETSLEPHSKYFVDPNTKAVVAMWDYMKAIEYLDPATAIDPYALIDQSIYREALTELAQERPSPFWDSLLQRYQAWNN